MSSSSLKHYKLALDALREQGPKMALHVCDKYVKKLSTPSEGPLMALRAFLLVQVGKEQQGIELAKAIKAQQPTDIDTLSQLEKVFITVSDYQSAVELWEAAFGKVPTEEIGVGLFLATLRTENHKKLFTVALSLKTAFKNPKFLYWAALALYLQTCNPAVGREKWNEKELKLAQALVAKEYEASSFRTVEELNLFLMLCDANGESKVALEVLRSTEKLIPTSFEVATVKSDLLIKTENYQEAFEFCAGLLKEKGVYDWAVWTNLMKALDGLGDDAHREGVRQILENSEGSSENPRNLLLAHIDAALHGAEGGSPSKAALLMAYSENAPQKTHRLSDIVFMLRKFSPEEKTEFRELVKEKLAVLDNPDRIHWAHLLRITSCIIGDWAAEGARNLVAQMAADNEDLADAEYLRGLLHLDLYMDDPTKTDALFVAAKHLFAAAQQQPEDFLARILLILTLTSAGAIFSALEIFRQLDIKQVQMDSLSYLISDHLINLGDLADSELFFHESFFIYDDNRMQTLSVVMEQCVKEAYSKIPEFYELFLRLDHSIQSIECITETIRGELLTKPVPELVEYLKGMKADDLLFTEELAGKICDNRDLDVVEFVDLSGRVKSKLLPMLPSYTKASVWSFTCLTLLLRAIALGDKALLDKLHADYCWPSYLHNEQASEMELTRAHFVKFLLDAFHQATCTADLQSLGDSIASFLSKNPIAVTKISGYTDLCALEWQVERWRICKLALAFFLHAQKPKARRSVSQALTVAIQALDAQSSSLKAQLTSLVFFQPEIDSPVAPIIQRNWNKSVEFLNAIVAFTSDLL